MYTEYDLGFHSLSVGIAINLPFLTQGHLVVRIDYHGLADILDGFRAGDNFGTSDGREGREDLGDITPPLLAETLVPVYGDGHAVGEAGLLLPPELAQLGAVDGVAVVVEGTVNGVLDPFVELLLRLVGEVEVGEEF